MDRGDATVSAHIQEVARLRSVVFLLQEAHRIAQEGQNTLLVSKIEDMLNDLDRLLKVS